MTVPPPPPGSVPPPPPGSVPPPPPPGSYPPPPGMPQGMPPGVSQSNGLATAALVCGILGFCTGIAGIAAIVLGILGRKKAQELNGTGSGQATAGLILGIITTVLAIIWVAIMVLSAAATKTAISTSINEQNKSVEKSQKESNTAEKDSNSFRFDERADKQKKDQEILIGETAKLDGIEIVVESAVYTTTLGEYTKADNGKIFVTATINLENTSSKTQPYNLFDFRIQTAKGVVLDPSWLLDNDLGSGDLVAGGKVSGNVAFEVPDEEGHQYIIWKPSFWNSSRVIIQVK